MARRGEFRLEFIVYSHWWGLVLVSALNETPDRVGLRYARKVFRDGFLRHPRGFEIELPAVN